MHITTCMSHVFENISFRFSALEPFGPAAEELLSRICQRLTSHAQIPEWEAHAWVFPRLSFVVMRMVAE